MLFDFLDRLRQKDEPARMRFAFFSALSVTLVIGCIWLLSVPAQLEHTRPKEPEKGEPTSGSIKDIRDVVRNAEILRGDAQKGPDSVTASTSGELEDAIPRRVIISTSSDEITP